MKSLHIILFSLLFSFVPISAFAVDGSDLIPSWTNPLPTSVYAFQQDIIVTGTWSLPADWYGKIYVYGDALLAADDSLLTIGTKILDVNGNTGYVIDNRGGSTQLSGTFSYNIGAQILGEHNIRIEFWGGETCAINKALNDLNQNNLLQPTCAITNDNAALNIVWPVRKYTVGAPLFPSLVVTPANNPAINFLNIEYGSPTTRIFTISNNGGQTLSGTVTGISTPFSCSPSCNYVVNPGGIPVTMTIQYVPPPAPSTSDQTFQFTCNGTTLACMKFSTTLPIVTTAQPYEPRRVIANSVANSVSPTISVSPAGPINYGTVNFGASVPDKTFIVRNTGGGYLTGSITFNGGGYSCIPGCNYSLASGESTTINVRYVPQTAGLHNDSAVFSGGLGTVVLLNSTVNTEPIVAAGTALMDFYVANGSRPINVGSCKSLTTWVQNVGSGLLSGSVTNLPAAIIPINDSVLNGGFRCTAGCTYNNLQNGQWQNFTIQYCPTVNAAETGSAILTNNSIPTNTAVISLTGIGNTQPVGAISVNEEVNFGNVLLNNTKSISFTLSNTGVGTLTGAVGVVPANFTCDGIIGTGAGPGCSYDIPAGGSVTVTFSFTPTAQQPYSGTVNFSGIASRILKGVGVQPNFLVSWNTWPNFACPGATCFDPNTPQPKIYNVGTTTYTGNINTNVQYKAFNLYSMNSGVGASVAYSFPDTANFKCIDGGWPYSIKTSGGCSGTLSWVGAGQYLQAPMYRFEPTAPGSYSELLTVTYDYGVGPLTKTVVLQGGSESAPYLDISPVVNQTFLPNPTQVGNPSPQIVYTVRNLGVGPMDYTVTGIPVGSTISCISNCSMTNLMPNIPVDVTFEFTPIDPLTTTVTVMFNSTGGNIPKVLTGRGSVSPITQLVPSSISFPNTNMGQYTNRQVRVTNTGLGTLSGIVTPVAPSGLDFFCILNCGYSLTAGQSTTDTTDPVIQFRPIQVGPLIGTLNFTGGSNGTQFLNVDGTAIFAPIIDIRGSDTNFGGVVLKRYKEKTYVVKNTGTADIGSGVFNISGPFVCVNPVNVSDGLCHYTLPAGGESTITIRYTPTILGDESGLVVLSSVPLARFFVTGRGIPGVFQVVEQ